MLLDRAKAQETADPNREIAGAIGEDAVGRAPSDREHDLAQLHPARIGRRLFAPGQIVVARDARLSRPADLRRRLNAFQRSAELRRRRDDAERRMVVAADLRARRRGRAPAAARSGNAEQRIACDAASDIRPPTRRTRSAASTRAFSLGLMERPTSPAKLSCSPSNVLERRNEPVTGQVEAFGEPGEGGARSLGPSGSAQNGDRPLRRPQHLLQFGHLRKARPDRDRLGARRVRHGRHFRQHVLGQRDHDRARPALHRDVKRALDNLRDLRGGLDLRRELCGRGEQSAGSPSPGRRPAPSSPARPGR